MTAFSVWCGTARHGARGPWSWGVVFFLFGILDDRTGHRSAVGGHGYDHGQRRRSRPARSAVMTSGYGHDLRSRPAVKQRDRKMKGSKCSPLGCSRPRKNKQG